MSRVSQSDYKYRSCNNQSSTIGLSYSSSQGKLQNYNDLNDYLDRPNNYQQTIESKGKFLLYFSSNFRKNKLQDKKMGDIEIPALNLDTRLKQQNQTNSPSMKVRPIKFTEKSKGEVGLNRTLKTDRSISYIGYSAPENQHQFKHGEGMLKKGMESHLNFKISPKKRASENYDRKLLTSRTYQSDQKPSTASGFEINLFEPKQELEEKNEKKLMQNNSTPYLLHYNNEADFIKQQSPEKKENFIKYKGSTDSTLNNSPSRGYFARKINDSPIRHKNQPLSISDFQQLHKLGKGKFGDVFVMKHIKLGFHCAIKVVQKQKVIKNNFIDQFCYEVKIQSYLKHPHLVSLYGIFHDETNIYLIMELLCDNTLYRHMRSERKLSKRQTSIWMKQICNGIQYMHGQKVMHRDIKPQNIIIHEGVAKIADFGWAAYYADESRTTFCGTPAYLSPEIVQQQNYTEKIDVWSLGLMAYEMVIGNLPFKIKSGKDLKKITNQSVTFPEDCEISKAVKQFILIALEKDPEVRADIDGLLAHQFLSFNLKEAIDWSSIEKQTDKLGLFCQIKISSLETIKGYKNQVKQATSSDKP